MINKIALDTVKTDNKTAFKELTKNFEDFLIRQKRVSNNTCNSYGRDVDKFHIYLEDAKMNAFEASSSDVSAFLDSMNKNHKATSTISRTLASLRCYYRYLEVTNQIKENPTKSVASYRVEKKEPQILTHEEIQILLDQPKCIGLKGYRDKAMLELLYAAGMRVSELINLLIEDVDIEAQTVLCRKGIRERIIPVHPSAIKAVKAYLDKSRPMMVLSENVPFLFVNCNGRKLTRQGFWKIIKLYKDMSKIDKDITPHTLRHSFAFHLLEKGIDVKTIQQMLGHTDISSTNMYVQLMNKKLNDLNNKIENEESE
ncbi:MAG: tyrosine recombinase [Clostridiales bacterium]|nr:tyrosine recombinase [Clostridiales bacterium]